MNTPSPKKTIDEIIAQSPSHPDTTGVIPHGSKRILDFGCGSGQVILTLKRDKACSDLYGVDIKEEWRALVEEHIDGFWTDDLGKPGVELDSEYEGYFNYIIMHDVVEHLYDPWYVVAKLRKYLAPSGELIVVVPNFRNWSFIYHLIIGSFRYGEGGGLMNEEHIRWFTLEGLTELVSLSGYEIMETKRLFPPSVDLAKLRERINEPFDHVELPPLEVKNQSPGITIQFPEGMDIRPDYMNFLITKYQMRCKASPIEVVPKPLSIGDLGKRRLTHREKTDGN